jgi:glycine C-acetyltransferase
VEDLARQLELPGRNKLVITEGVFSMDGAFAPLDAIHELCERHEAALFLDDAHGFCVVGPTGGGVPEIHGLQGKIDLLMGTLSKAIPCFGGYIAGKKAVIDYLRYMSRSFKFTVTLPPPVVCAILACLDLVEAHPELRTDLLKKSAYFREALQSRGFSSGTPGSPIVPVFIRDELKTMELARLMEDEGVYVDPSIFPGVQRGEELLRFAVTNKHTTEQLDMTVDALDRCARKMAFHS